MSPPQSSLQRSEKQSRSGERLIEGTKKLDQFRVIVKKRSPLDEDVLRTFLPKNIKDFRTLEEWELSSFTVSTSRPSSNGMSPIEGRISYDVSLQWDFDIVRGGVVGIPDDTEPIYDEELHNSLKENFSYQRALLRFHRAIREALQYAQEINPEDPTGFFWSQIDEILSGTSTRAEGLRRQEYPQSKRQIYFTVEKFSEEIERLSEPDRRKLWKTMSKKFGMFKGSPQEPQVTERRRDLLYKVILTEYRLPDDESGSMIAQIRQKLEEITPAGLRDRLRKYPDVMRYYQGLDDAKLRALLYRDLKSIQADPDRYFSLV